MPQHFRKYSAYPHLEFPERTWPSKRVTVAPIWCSVDLRDGNQALVEPMSKERKLALFEYLVRVGYREIEVGFPAASQTDFDFVRLLIEERRIPETVTIQVLVPARLALIERTFEAIRGANRVIVHLYNSTSTVQRRVVFGMSEQEVCSLAVQGTRWVKEMASRSPGTEVVYEYSPESFTGTELEVAQMVCDAVIEEWNPSPDRKMILNLPATVELSGPNVYADRVEWMIRHLRRRDDVIVSVHTHNDRGCAVAATELALLAGAERVEGTLLGNGERTGNVDLVTLAMNLYSQGIDPKVDLSNLPELVEVFETASAMTVHPRHPYAGEFVFTAFSGSHQDAIRKGLECASLAQQTPWEVPYLPIDPADVGRRYETLVRINSQSGKSGVAFVLERAARYKLPKALAVELGRVIQEIADDSGKELSPEDVVAAFEREYVAALPSSGLAISQLRREGESLCHVEASVEYHGRTQRFISKGEGPIDAFLRGLREVYGQPWKCVDYAEHAMMPGADAMAVAYVALSDGGRQAYGVGKASDISVASIRAVWGAAARLLAAQETAGAAQ